MDERKLHVGITHGDTNGIGYELIFKTFAEPAMLELCTPIIYGSPKIATYYRNLLGIEANFTIISQAEEVQEGRVNLLTVMENEIKVAPGTANPEAGEAALVALERATNDYKNGLFDVLVALPINKSVMQQERFPFNSQAKYIENALGDGQEALPMLVNDRLRIGMLTDHLPVKDTAQAISMEQIIAKGTALWTSMKRDFRLSNPRIAVLSLNPLTDENTFSGSEESEIILPAIRALEEKGIQAFGPYPVDRFFGERKYDAFDAVLAMYQDQATVPFKTLDLGNGINYTAGLQIVSTSPLQGVSYDIAGKGLADEQSFHNAIYNAIDIFRNRAEYDLPLAHPLPKLYHEKKDDSEKVRFTIPKSKNENKKTDKE